MSSFFMEHDRKNFEVYAFSTLEAVTNEAVERRNIIKKQVCCYLFFVLKSHNEIRREKEMREEKIRNKRKKNN